MPLRYPWGRLIRERAVKAPAPMHKGESFDFFRAFAFLYAKFRKNAYYLEKGINILLIVLKKEQFSFIKFIDKRYFLSV